MRNDRFSPDRGSRGGGYGHYGYGRYDSPGAGDENGPLESPPRRSRQDPRYAWSPQDRPGEGERSEYEYEPPSRYGEEYGERPRRSGTRALRSDEWLYSRSADPGQSSYGGFRGEDPSYQRQDLGPSGGRHGHSGGDWRREAYAGQGSSGASGQRYWRDRYPEEHDGAGFGAFGDDDMGDGFRASGQRIDAKGYIRSDERVREIVCERLSHSGWDVSDVSVDVDEGRVTLEGTVPDRRTKHRVEDCVDQCSGVKDVENRIKVADRQAT